jgi:hypothetical protein
VDDIAICSIIESHWVIDNFFRYVSIEIKEKQNMLSIIAFLVIELNLLV